MANKARPVLTTNGGALLAENQNSLSAGPCGLLLQDYVLIKKLTM